MDRRAMLIVLLCCTAAAVQARLLDGATGSFGSRQLQANNRCPAGCVSDRCELDATTGGYRCTKCQGALVLNMADGTCVCPAGRSAVENSCVDCVKGSYCLGGLYVDNGSGSYSPAAVACGTDLTTIGKRSTSKKACVNVAGTSYSVDVNGDPSASGCLANFYSTGFKKQRACVPCPPGFTTNGEVRRTGPSACIVPEGYFLKGPVQVAPCPKGEWKSGVLPAASCSKCAAGVTTADQASVSAAACKIVLPTFYPLTIVANEVTVTKKCPQKYYCAGGEATATFNPESPPTDLTGTTMTKCLKGAWTQGLGSWSADQCLIPPGYKNDGSDTIACADGEYRAEWKPAAFAGTCDSCGTNIASEATEEITAYDISTETATPVTVRTSAAACYLSAGQGMYFSAATGKYRAVNCDNNNYGVAAKTFGLASYPCRECPVGMQTSVLLSASNDHHATNGFKSPLACVTKKGYGYNGRLATRCPLGSYNNEGNYGTCTQCAAGLTTLDDANEQAVIEDCVIKPGYGWHDNAVVPCPIGTYNSAVRSDTATPCTPCGTGLTTATFGGDSTEDCNVCAIGYGGANCGTQCGAPAATYGPAGREAGEACVTCPAMTIGFSFTYESTNYPFAPAVVARVQANSAGDCLAEFAQIEDAAWYLGGNAALTAVSAATTFDDCITACKTDGNCQYVTFDYAASSDQCMKRTTVTAASGNVLAFKTIVAGDASAASKGVKGKASASGSYTFWMDAGTDVGVALAGGDAANYPACLAACDNNYQCAAVRMTGVTSSETAAISGCQLLKGINTVAQNKRSMTKAVTTKLTIASAL